jgi:hypothetical protein
LKANIDVDRDQHDKVMWGLVIWNNNEEVVHATMEKTEVVVEPVLAEILGLRWDMLMVHHLHLWNVMFELDASIVVNCFNGLSHIVVSLDSLIELSTS